MYCPRCGTVQSDTASSCTNCSLNLTKATPFAPYVDRVENNFHAAAMLIFLFPLVGLLARTQVDHPIVQYGGILIAIVCPLIGIANIMMSTAVDSARRQNNLPGANGKAKLAKTMKLAGYAVGFPVLALIVGTAFLSFLSSGGHGAEGGGASDSIGAMGGAEEAPAAPAEAAAAEGEKAPAAAGDKAPAEAKKEEAAK